MTDILAGGSWLTVWQSNWLVSFEMLLLAISEKGFSLVRPGSCAISSPRFLELGTIPEPFHFCFPAKPHLYDILFMRKTLPRFLTDRKMKGKDILDCSASAIFAVLSIRPTFPNGSISYCSSFRGIICHVVVSASVQLDSSAIVLV